MDIFFYIVSSIRFGRCIFLVFNLPYFSIDDGKLFMDSGVGEQFGPRCFEGDIMGCGIMYPRDFKPDGRGEYMFFSTVSHRGTASNCLFCLFLSDDIDYWDLDEIPKPSKVQNYVYANNREENEDEVEYLEGRKVTVRCRLNLGIYNRTYLNPSQQIFNSLLCFV